MTHKIIIATTTGHKRGLEDEVTTCNDKRRKIGAQTLPVPPLYINRHQNNILVTSPMMYANSETNASSETARGKWLLDMDKSYLKKQERTVTKRQKYSYRKH